MWAPQNWQQPARQGWPQNGGQDAGQLISGPSHALIVAARQKLQTPDACANFIESLLMQLDQFTQAGQKINFKDFDISQNKIPYDAWETLFIGLGAQGGRIERLRVFGCPTANDDVAALMAQWLANVTAETAPTELHLSDCAFTTEGFRALMEAFEKNEAFPTSTGPQRPARPLYVRLENNYIDPAAIQDTINGGAAITFQKGPNMHATGEGSGAKIKILCHTAGEFAQKKGTPPPPEAAPAPRPVKDWQPKPWEGAQQSWSSPQVGWQTQAPPAAQTWLGTPRPAVLTTPHLPRRAGAAGAAWPAAAVRPPASAWAARPAAAIRPAAGFAFARPQVVRPLQQTAVKPAHQAVRAADRSRSPPLKAGASSLPGNWEEHWSDEFGIPYYWDTETGDSMWEKPT